MSIISAENINFSYTEKPVMEDVSFAIDEAQIVAIIGPNGSGKTTLLKIINGTLFPDAGQMLIDGKDTRAMVTKGYCPKSCHCSAGNSRRFFLFTRKKLC